MQYSHIPVLTKEVLQYLSPRKNQNFIDCTLGLGGHSEKILEKSAPNGKLLAIEQSVEGLNEVKKRLEKYKDRITFVHGNFRNLDEIVRRNGFQRVAGIVYDLGLASWQIDDPIMGLSFSKDMPLDMRVDDHVSVSAAEIINKYTEKQLANLFFELGDVRSSRRLAKNIIIAKEQKPIETTKDLVKAIGIDNPKVLAPVFQALRIEVNHELDNLSISLPKAKEIIELKGRIAVISFHSGEDRIAKNFFRSNKGELKILTKKPIIASSEEIKQNSRARSAKLRAAEKI